MGTFFNFFIVEHSFLCWILGLDTTRRDHILPMQHVISLQYVLLFDMFRGPFSSRVGNTDTFNHKEIWVIHFLLSQECHSVDFSAFSWRVDLIIFLFITMCFMFLMNDCRYLDTSHASDNVPMNVFDFSYFCFGGFWVPRATHSLSEWSESMYCVQLFGCSLCS